jgi:hypothetical protein
MALAYAVTELAEVVEATITKSQATTVMIKCLITQCGKAWLFP